MVNSIESNIKSHIESYAAKVIGVFPFPNGKYVDRNSKNTSSFVYFANLEASGEKYTWDESKIEKVLNTIENKCMGNATLSINNIGKFFLAFPFGFVAYTFGDGDKESPNTGCLKYAEYEFNNDYSDTNKIDIVVPCALEIKLMSLENDIWMNSEKIVDYYNAVRKSPSIRNKFPNKKLI